MLPTTQYGEPAGVHVALTIVPGGIVVPHVSPHGAVQLEPCARTACARIATARNEHGIARRIEPK
jgi:hypothetical protein